MTTEFKRGDKPKKKRFKNKWFLTLFIIEACLFVSQLIIFIIAIAVQDFDLSFKLAGIGGAVFGVFVGSLFLIFLISALFAFFKRSVYPQPQGDDIVDASKAPYPTVGNIKERRKTTKPYYCLYCGYKANKNESECPKCGGPIKEG